ncbi:MAG: Gfo/Idh/MocA family oxidoreductase [Clostridia bacterium]|nr:Gfo/Idh/MocA family oxidoreductase [Clostridia bacterium]
MLKVGLIGCGFMGAMHANCYKNLADVEIVALADLRREKAEELAAGTNAAIYGDGYDLIAQADVDIIDICLPTYLHAEYAMKAMEKVKYVFVEKPVALTAEEGDAMLKKAQETGVCVQVGQVIRFWDEYVALKGMIESGKYGKVVNANFRRLSPRPTWGWEDWLLDNARSGGAGQDLHIHDVDYALSLFGEPKTFCSVRNVLGEPKSYVNTLMQYEDFVVGVEGTWDLPASYPFTATFRVVLEQAVVENAGGKFMLYTNDGAEEIVIEKKELVGGVEGGNISDLGGYYNELLYFCEQAKKGASIEKATLADGVSSLKFLLKELAYHA